MIRIHTSFPLSGTDQRPIKSQKSKHGFLMAMDFSDQMTGASANLMNLQCFAGRHLINVSVVEPFIHPIGSTLGVSLSPSFNNLKPENMNTVKHSDVFDSKEWTQIASSNEYAPLISWNEFMNSCPKKLIFVHHVYHGKKSDHCEKLYSIMVNATHEFVTENKFEVVKRVCLNFKSIGILSPEQFIDRIYGDFKANEVVVIFNRWGGFSIYVEDYMLSVKGTPCIRGKEKRLYHHSKQLLNDVKQYSDKYMDKTRKYLAVMVRVEFFANNNHFNELPADAQRTKLMKCFDSINQKVTTVKRDHSLNAILLTLDVGKHGSIWFRMNNGRYSSRLNMTVLNETIPKFLDSLMGHSFSQTEWEDSFEHVARFKVPGYIASMQLELAANSVCLLQAGGGTFQQSAMRLYNELHQESTRCTLSACQ